MRTFNHKILELLAPAGNFSIFESVLRTNCDAIYFGGQSLNMRLIRKGFNFSDAELSEAVKLAHEHDKKAYITVNNLVGYEEISSAERFLESLSKIKPDAIIIQDFAILELIKKHQLPLDIHASVMMNVHNVPMVMALKKHGVSRVVLSREATLDDVRWIKEKTGMEIEYFTHGDMCIAHGGQCYYSSLLFGMSSNRGKCLKPCRWWFSKSQNDDVKSYSLAVKDLSLYHYLPEMIHAGVTSFKLEGRMREKDFIIKLTNQYGDALDRFIEDPAGYDRDKDYNEIYKSRKRDLSTAYAFGKPGIRNINTRFEGTGKFYSTGKMFSTPTLEKSIDQEQTDDLRSRLSPGGSTPQQDGSVPSSAGSMLAETSGLSSPKGPNLEAKDGPITLSVRVNTEQQAKAAIGAGIDRLYLSADVYQPELPFTIKQVIAIKNLIEAKSPLKTELYVATPRMMNECQFEIYTEWLKKIRPFIDGILVGNLGAIEAFKPLGIKMAGDYSLNVFNSLSAQFYLKEGLDQVTASLELNAEGLRSLCEGLRTPSAELKTGEVASGNLEVVAYGRLTAMYFEHDFHEALSSEGENPLKLYNEAGCFDIFKDQHGRTHMLTTHRLNLLPLLHELTSLGVNMLRIEGLSETPEALSELIKIANDLRFGNLSQQDILGWIHHSESSSHFDHIARLDCFENPESLGLSRYTYGALPFKMGE